MAYNWDVLRGKIAGCRGRGTDGFAAGWIDYDGSFCFGFYEQFLVFRHLDKKWVGVGDLASRFCSNPEETPMPKLDFKPEISRGQFCEMVRRAKEYIAAGDIYQVNLSHRFAACWSGGDAFLFYEALRRCSPAPQAAYLELGGRAVLSSSPETFLQMSGRVIRTRPIKGTRPRLDDTVADAQSAAELLASQKEAAELVMITDLERNDLGRVCEYASVTVRELLKLERYEQVFHLVSTVEGRLRDGVDHPAALRACFPGGSITGAPKKRAMEIISELEPAPRGLYTGAIGWFGFNGQSRFNIAIRTVVVENGLAHFHVGAGIVADSDPEAEYEETLHKAAGILLAAKETG
jgi:aminodeoxychorismate synthase component I